MKIPSNTISLLSPFHSLYEIFFESIPNIMLSKDSIERTSESNVNMGPSSKPILRRQMTSLGRFALRSETVENPSVITFFVALAHKADKDLNVKDFENIWTQRVLEKHERFHCQISRGDDRFFEVVKDRSLDSQIINVQHPQGRLAERIEASVLSEMDVTKGLWDVALSCGKLGSSGAIQKDAVDDRHQGHSRETVALFRVHHSLCDGVSIAVAIGDLADEAAYLQDRMLEEIQMRKTKRGEHHQAYFFFLISMISSFLFIARFAIACIYALILQIRKMLVSRNPFDAVLLNSQIPSNRRSIHWTNVGSLEEMKGVAKNNSDHTTINDVACAMVTHAIKRQLMEHRDNMGSCIAIPQEVNITIPVHLHGGILRPGEQLGNNIGGFVSTIPLTIPERQSSSSRLYQISRILQREKALPSPIISWQLARVFTRGPVKFCTYMLKKFSANSVAVISNVRGFPIPVHWLGREVQSLYAFLPLPPGIPIGVVISSYAGVVSIGLNADKRAIPSGGHFSNWMIEEYEHIKNSI